MIEFFKPKGTRSGSTANPNPTATLLSKDSGKKPYRAVHFNKAALALIGEETPFQIAVASNDNGVFFTPVSEEVVKENSGNFGRVGKNGNVVSVTIYDEVVALGDALSVVQVEERVFQFVSTTEQTNPVENTTEATPEVVEETVEVEDQDDPFGF